MALPTIPDYNISIKTPKLILPSILRGGYPLIKRNTIIKYAGGFCVVYPFETPNGRFAVRCWHASIANTKKRTEIISHALKSSQLPYFVKFDYYKDGIVTSQGRQPIVVMDWVEAKPLKEFISDNIHNPNKIDQLAENFKKMAMDLHRHNFSHGDLQHGNIMVKDDASLILVDYDSMYVPGLEDYEDEIKGLTGYQHPARWTNKYANPKADYFSELVIYTSLKALKLRPEYWESLNMENTETLLFTQEDIQSKGNSMIFKELMQYDELKLCVKNIKEALSKNTIDCLLPIEKSTKNLADKIGDMFAEIPPLPEPNYGSQADLISKKF